MVWPGSLPSAVGVVMDEDSSRGCVEVRAGAGREVCGRSQGRTRGRFRGVPVERNLSGITFAVAKVRGMPWRGWWRGGVGR